MKKFKTNKNKQISIKTNKIKKNKIKKNKNKQKVKNN
jgi:hypothetical protein